MGSFTPLIFGTNGGMGEECKMFMKHLAEKLADKDVEGYPIHLLLAGSGPGLRSKFLSL